jgi:hypothetical protein
MPSSSYSYWQAISQAAANQANRQVLPLTNRAQAMAVILLASATATTLNGRRAGSRVTQGYLFGLCLARHEKWADHHDAPQVVVALFGCWPSFNCPSDRNLPWRESNPGRKVAP